MSEKLPVFGTRENRFEAIVVVAASFVLTMIYSFIADLLETPTTRLEFWSLVFSFACVWLSRRENIHSMSTGIVAVILMGIFLLRIDLVGQGWLQFLYYVPVQIYGWWAWCRGGSDKTELAVTRLSARGLFAVAVVFLASWRLFNWIFGTIYDQPQYLLWDTSIVAASVVAQALMSRKKVECWFFWSVPVNVSAIALYWVLDVPAFSFLYSIFLLNAVWGWLQWHKSAQGQAH